METFFSTLGYGFLALLAVAVLVATWEHLRRSSGLAPAPPRAETASPRASHIDVDLAQLAQRPPEGDQAQRRSTANEALIRAARPPDENRFWTETRPMVAPGGAEPVNNR